MVGWRRVVVTAATAAAILLATTSCTVKPGPVTVNGRTLLTYSAGSTRGAAALEGILGINTAGCLTVGKLVLVVPSGSELGADGSITVAGTTYKFGGLIHVGGGGGKSPGPNSCGNHVSFWYI